MQIIYLAFEPDEDFSTFLGSLFFQIPPGPLRARPVILG